MSSHRPIRRFVALGDSFTEGVGDPDPARPNGVRGWADQVAEVLAGLDPDFGYANLAIRGRKLRQIVVEQVGRAVAMEPDLVTIYAGGNDIMRPQVDLDALVECYAGALDQLVDTGARVVVWTAFDPGGSLVYRPFRGRFALYNEAVRELAEDRGATIVDFWRMREYRDWRYWSPDRMHMGPIGHRRMANRVLMALEIPRRLPEPPLPEIAVATRAGRWRSDLDWSRTHLGPWVHRRMTGRSSGDGLSPRFPTPVPMAPSVEAAPVHPG